MAPSRAEPAGASFECVGKLMGIAQLLRYSATDTQRATAIVTLNETLNETRLAL